MAVNKDPENKNGEPAQPLPYWAKLLIGVCGVVIIAKWTPLFEILTMFFYVVVVPVLFFGCILVGGTGALEGALRGWKQMTTEINARVDQKIEANAA